MSEVKLAGAVKVLLEGPPAPKSNADAEAAKEAREGRVAVATTLATGITVLVATVGLFGGLTGAVARLVRNYPVEAGGAIVAVIVSVALAVVARLVAAGVGDKKAPGILVAQERRPYWSTAILWLSVLLLAVGLTALVALLVATIGKDDRPSVSGQSTRDATSGVASVAGTAKAGGLAAEDAIRIVVISFAAGQTEEGTQLYYAVVGPNPDGVVDHSFTVMLPDDARSVVITAGNDAADTSGAPGTCQPDGTVDAPVDPAAPIEVSGEEGDEPLTACALVSIPIPPAVQEADDSAESDQ